METLRVAAVQATPVGGDTGATVAKACDLIGECGQQRAKIAVFPEAFIGGHPKGAAFNIFVGVAREEPMLAVTKAAG